MKALMTKLERGEMPTALDVMNAINEGTQFDWEFDENWQCPYGEADPKRCPIYNNEPNRCFSCQ